MKDKIITYGKEYVSNFKQNPLSTTAVLIMQIIFILGWGIFFLYLFRLYSSFVIPGVTNPKGNIYADTLYTILQFTLIVVINSAKCCLVLTLH